MRDRVEAPLGEDALDGSFIAQVGLVQRESRIRRQRRCVGSLPRWAVVIVEVVQPDDGIAASQQRFRQVTADKSGRAGHEDMHRLLL